eukprot:TRINITY_DN820_c0_g2_i1.p1 TRINITY_DN820_c0_g2~~TRINITY_DN820_c0_g2_i1.p1  ORF type:complete len:105 (-),score=11.45 TRINITY_DN820_c0_g2_i1:92-406(-)
MTSKFQWLKGSTHYDVHLYYDMNTRSSAEQIHTDTKQLFPDVPIYNMVDREVGPHTSPMWEAHLVNEAQFHRYLTWLDANIGSHSALVHPNTKDMQITSPFLFG